MNNEAITREEKIEAVVDDMCYLENVRDSFKRNKIRDGIKVMDDESLDHAYVVNRELAINRKSRIAIERFIIENGYTYGVNDIIEDYKRYWIKGLYTSSSMTHCIENLEKEIKALLAL